MVPLIDSFPPPIINLPTPLLKNILGALHGELSHLDAFKSLHMLMAAAMMENQMENEMEEEDIRIT